MSKWVTRFIIYSIIGSVLKNAENKDKKEKLPEFKGVFEVKHSIPGRIRFKVNPLKGNEDLNQINFILDSFQKIDGIKDISINTTLGTILISYDINKLQPLLIMGVLIRLLGLESSVGKKPKSVVTSEVENITDSLNLAVYDKTNGLLDMKNIIMLTLIGIGIYKIKRQPRFGVSGSTSLWWAYSFIK